MASEAEVSEATLLERLISSRNRDLSVFIPFILGFGNPPSSRQDMDDPDEEPTNSATPRDRIVLINPFTQGMVVIEGSSSIDALLRELRSREGQPPASRASVEALPDVEITEDGECVICLEDWEVGGVAKEMPCKHRFHGNCIHKWLGIHGSCPVCRFKMPVEEEEVSKKREGDDDEGRGRRRIQREIWMSFSFNSSVSSIRRNSNSTPSTDSSDSSSTTRSDDEMES